MGAAMYISESITFAVELEFILPFHGISWSDGQEALVRYLEESGIPATQYSEDQDSNWLVKDDHSLTISEHSPRIAAGYTPSSLFAYEISSPVFWGQEGLEQIEKVFIKLADLGAYADEGYAFQAHINPLPNGIGRSEFARSPFGRRFTWDEAHSIIAAASGDQDSYLQLIAPERHGDTHCRHFLSIGDNVTTSTLRQAPLGDLIVNVKAAKVALRSISSGGVGTFEDRGKEAVGFNEKGGIEQLAHLCTMVNFMDAARRDPTTTFQSAAHTTLFGHGRTPTDALRKTRTGLLAARR